MNPNEKISYKNELGDLVIFQFAKPYFLLGKSGFDEANYKIASEKLYGFDGELAGYGSLNPRELMIKAAVSGQNAEEEFRFHHHLIKSTNPKNKGKLTYEIYDKKYELDVQVVKSWADEFEPRSRTLQGSVQFKAFTPYWRDVSLGNNIQYLGKSTGMMTFPWNIPDGFIFEKVEVGAPAELVNSGHVPVGFVLNMGFTSTVKNPRIVNIYTKEQFAFNYTFKAGDQLFMDTNRNSKSVRLNGNNAYGLRKLDSKFLQLDHLKKNYLVLEADEGLEFMLATIEFYPLLIGV